jgi:hypothetical protein
VIHPVTFFIRPAPGLRIADPDSGGYLPETGALMPRSAFWLRRQKDGDVVEASPPATAKEAVSLASDAVDEPEPSKPAKAKQAKE